MLDDLNPALPDPIVSKVVLHGVHYVMTVCIKMFNPDCSSGNLHTVISLHTKIHPH